VRQEIPANIYPLMIILGIDPGTTSIGYAIVHADANPRILDAGLLDIPSHAPEERLRDIHHGIQKLITAWHPTCISVERLYFARNVKTAIAVSEGRGVILLTAVLEGIKVYEYTPLAVKRAVTGDGRADKKQMQKMVLKEAASIPPQDDVFDAIASALACCYLTRQDTTTKR
jgi:crossover junction endodeoxyribonuclease RuvC